ncbi:PREDICTED: acyl-coenzyme A thioesterase 13-like isoform X2 [Ipomoea nil]|uniref:acyl-coenzyme A thioesterase 13-like isoform X2 n=1 Tax=Ipomoea nil TaxID=35883 RepID=UPI000900FCC2|nr:PREDICTED: acyl-coenzyme A thioesterase 13-like isoform X2 [Ipomoea nil]
MEKAKESVEAASKEEAERVSSLSFTPHRLGVDLTSFYRYFSLRGIRVDRCRPGFISCTFKVPPRLIDKNGNLGCGAIATLVDEVGCAMGYVEGVAFNVTVDISITYLSTAKLHDELEITGRVLGKRGSYFGTSIVVKNKASGEIIAEGRNSLYRNPINNSKM